jgi:2-iminobutanoate/2-iminopropanoate deaminase
VTTLRRCISTPDAPPPIGPYCQGNIAGPFVFTAEVGGDDPRTGKPVPGGITEQTEQTINNIQAILRAGGCDLGDVAKVTVYLADLADFKPMNEVYKQRFPEPFPARAIVQTKLPSAAAKVAMDAVALRP